MKKRKIATIFAAALFFAGSVAFMSTGSRVSNTERYERAEELRGRQEQEFKMLRNPATNKIPANIFHDEQVFAQKLPKRNEFVYRNGILMKNENSLSWTERGPNNVGGRVRGLGLDVADANTLIAGGVSGGLWKSTDNGHSWKQTTQLSQLHNVSCLVQDVRSGKTNIWYAGTGEGSGNSADGGWGAPFRGDGIFKSTDDGDSWTLLPATSHPNTPQITNYFDYVWNIAVDPHNTSGDLVYAATMSGIWKSSDGGASWNLSLGDSSKTTMFSDVVVASDGTVIASGNSSSSMAGIFVSTDEGAQWSNINDVKFPTEYNRIVLAVSSSAQSLYAFANTPGVGQDGDQGKQEEYISLWYYNVGTSTWTDRSANLPPFVDPVAGISTQGSYDMILRLKPGTEDFLVIGGTNLYISTDGFATNSNTHWVGGYATSNDISQYAHHHPDQHSGMFGAGNIYYSGDDGGIQETTDITAESVTWRSLDNSFNVTQAYSVAIEPVASSNFIFAGFQDNGCWYADSAGASIWTNAGSGDGAIVEVGNSASDNTIFSTSQNGGLDRYDKAGNYLSAMQPTQAAHVMFTNPLALDPTNSSLMYYGGGTSATTTGIWRNTDALNGDSTQGWGYIANTDPGSETTQVSAIAVSTASQANVVYYGTDEGYVLRIDNANGDTPTVTDVSTGIPYGYVSGIAVDPTNSQKAIVVLSNYDLQSIWMTTNGGTTWSDIEGNLAGAAGPSVRSVRMFYISNVLHVFVGTSVGLFYTTNLNGTSTVWTEEAASSIGNVIVTALDFRSADNTLAVATHGRGVFTSAITTPLSVGEPAAGAVRDFVLEQNYPNPFNPSTTIRYTLRTPGMVTIAIYDVGGKRIATLVDHVKDAGSYTKQWDPAGFASGTYFYRMTVADVQSGRIVFTKTNKMIFLK